MDEAKYLLLADAALEKAADWLEEFDPDVVDFGTTDGVVTIEFPCGQKYILNRQRGSHQMWFAAGAEAWHYDWSDEREAWLDDKDGHELFANLEARVRTKAGL